MVYELVIFLGLEKNKIRLKVRKLRLKISYYVV